MTQNSHKKPQPDKIKTKLEHILRWDTKLGLLIPIKWKHPYIYRKKDYYAFLIGLNHRFEFERIFLEKIEFESDELETRHIGIGFHKKGFRDNLILEEKYSYKKDKSFVTETNYYKIILTEEGVWGEKISKNQIKDFISQKQQQIYQRFKEVFNEFGEEFTLYTMQSILKQKSQTKQYNIFFLE